MNPEHYNFNRKMITSIGDALRQVIVTESTSETNLRLFRERRVREKEEKAKRAEENRAAREAREAEKNSPEAVERRLALDRQRVDTEKNRNSANPRSEAETTLLNASLARLRNAGENVQMPRREPGPNAGKIRTDSPPDIGANGRPLSINRDGSFNIPQETQPSPQSPQSPRVNPRDESAATRRGRIAQRVGDIAFRPPRNQDEKDRLAAAEADLESAYDEAANQGTGLGYEDQGDLYQGFERRGFEVGGDTRSRPPTTPRPAPRPFTPPQRPTPLAPRPTPPSPIAPKPTPPSPLNPQVGEEDFSQLFGSRYRTRSGGPRYA